MALALLKKVAEKALGSVGSMAQSAFNYLSKQDPGVIIDKALEGNPQTRVFSKKGQEELANLGRIIQKTPDTTIRTPEAPKFIEDSPALSLLFNNPVQQAQNKIGEFVTGMPGEFARSWGRTIERTATPEGRAKQFEGAKQLPGQVGKIISQPGHRLEGLGELVDNPALEDALNATDLFTLGAGTILKSSGKEATEQAVKQVVKKGTKTATKEILEQAVEKAPNTIVKEATEGTTKKLFKKTTEKYVAEAAGEAENRKLAQQYLKQARADIPEAAATLSDDELAMKALNDYRNGAPLSQEVVETVTKKIGEGTRKTAEFFQKPVEIAKRWINTREGFTNWRAADIKKTPGLTQFDNEGMDAILELQAGANPTKFKAVKDFTDGLFELEQKSGLLRPDQYRTNYLPQMWDNTPEQIEEVFRKTAGGKPGFSKARILEDYAEGIKAGLTPRYNRISDLLEARFKAAQRALADNEMLESLWRSGNAKTLDKAPTGWQVIDMKYQGKTIAVPPEVAKMVKNYLGEGSSLLAKTAEFVSNAKQTILSAGIPRTGWNFHTSVNIPVRRVVGGKNPFSGVVDTVIWNTNPKSAEKYIASVPKDITDGLLKAGMNISRTADDAGYGFKPKEGVGKIAKARTWFDKMFSEVAFDKVLPAHKLKVGWQTYQDALKNGATQDEAFKIAAETANTLFGGVNPAAMGRSKDFQNVLRTLLLAPDWLESNVRIAGKTGGLLNPSNWSKAEYAPYKRFAVNAAAMYTSFAMLNKALSGHFPWENGAGQEFNLATGTYDERGRERMIPAFGTAFDFIRIPYQIVSGMASGDSDAIGRAIRNRLSPPASAATSLFITGEDYRGRPIDDLGDVAAQVGQAVGIPSQITNTLGFLRGDQTGEELLAGLLEAPLRFYGGARNKEDRETAAMLKEGGASNEDVAAAFKREPKEGGLFSNLIGGASSGSNISVPKTKAQKKDFDKKVDTALENGANDFSDEVLRERFFNGKTYKTATRTEQKDMLEEMLKVADNEYLTPEQKTKIANSAGVDGIDLQYYRTASMSQEDRLEGLLEFASAEHENREEFVQDLMLGKRAVGGKSLFSTEMFNRLYDEGLISKEEKALITAVKFDPIYKKFYMDRDYKGSGGTSESKIRSYISSINALHKDSIGSLDKNAQSLIEELSKPTEIPQVNLPRAKKKGASSTSSWFTQY